MDLEVTWKQNKYECSPCKGRKGTQATLEITYNPSPHFAAN